MTDQATNDQLPGYSVVNIKNISDIGIICPFNLSHISHLKITVSEFEEPDHDDEPLGGAVLV